ncbi:MAG TPA: FAD-linked oxidase C-terminal domain-containing protein [Thermoplasmata archaeon]|nr:FAD-linked oxidase C-terminal domain-containing protein [Thermoplasmata archaeon]
MFIGSEGTLGIATEVTVRLAPRPSVLRGLVVPLPARVRLGLLAVRLGQAADTGLSAVEYLDHYSASGLADERGAPWAGRSALLLLEVEAESEQEAERRTGRIRAVLVRNGVPARPQVFPDADRLWDLRGESGRVMDEQLGSRIREDVAVPPARVDELLAAVRRIARRENVAVHTFAHLGEGSLHPNIVVDPASAAARRIRRALYAETLRLGGTISAEHGVGRLKRAFLEQEVGPVAVRLLRAVRDACDPDGILNPGKLYPPPRARGRSSRSPSGSGSGRTRSV